MRLSGHLKPHPRRPAKSLYWGRAWSLVEDCTTVSEGCDYCWAAEGAHMPASNPNAKLQAANEGLTCDRHFNGTIRTREDRLELPLKVKKPQIWCIWTDLLHERVYEPFIDQVLEVISACPQHIFLACTKRPQNLEQKLYGYHRDVPCRALGGGDYIPNLWLGFTGENQEWFDQRWKHLRQIPAPVIFVSHEPALGSITYPPDFLARRKGAGVITGGETGSRARPIHPDWPRHDRDQCQQAHVPFGFKHWGEFCPELLMAAPDSSWDRTGKKEWGALDDEGKFFDGHSVEW